MVILQCHAIINSDNNDVTPTSPPPPNLYRVNEMKILKTAKIIQLFVKTITITFIAT